MPNTDDLTQQMGNLALNYAHQPSQHLLTFDYPAIDLLNDAGDVFLLEPHLLHWRPRPQALMFHLAEWDPMSLFYTMNSTAPACDVSDVDSEQAVSFLAAVESLNKSNGTSTMSIVVHVENAVAEVRIRLSTTWARSNTTKTTFWDLSVDDWETIMALSHPWVEVLGDVVYRKTTRSFLAAEQTLKQHSSILHHGDNQKWTDSWGSGSASSAQTLLVKVVKYLGHRHSDSLLPFDNLEVDGGTVQLPCGHDISITPEMIENLTDAECINATCNFCDTRILPSDLYVEAKMSEESYKILEASDKHDGWTTLTHEITITSTRPFSKNAIMNAIPAAVDSLKLPETIESARMSPVSLRQTSVALATIKHYLDQQPDTIDKSPFSLAYDLESLAVEAVMGEGLIIPPTWRTFNKIALTRAVNLASLRRCSKIGDGHDGVHMHGRKLFVSVPYMTEGDTSFDMGDLREVLDVEMGSD
ncbi:hypothetical protein PRZ48_012910 [Zasmidium cellare]|uniref:Uncharacterized protein n=1 Tax=Zasmidium cellare TaxID=395010 RepID=A0ABR0E2K1_ZASCE|nr:hypothetical protein PRZ48_012910 [Zasmidium cellare]